MCPAPVGGAAGWRRCGTAWRGGAANCGADVLVSKKKVLLERVVLFAVAYHSRNPVVL